MGRSIVSTMKSGNQTGVLSAIGNTPLVLMTRAIYGAEYRVFAKLEGLNPGGSSKDRAAYSMIKSALDTGKIDGTSTIVESTSGNMGIGLAQVCSWFGMKLICVIDPKIPKDNVRILEAFGAETVMVTKPDSHTGEYLPARLSKVRELLAELPNGYCPDQYGNPNNAIAHEDTMREICNFLDNQVDFLFVPTSTCGTLKGCSDWIDRRGLQTRIVAVDAAGSAIFGDCLKARLLPGHGAAIRPKLSESMRFDSVFHITDAESIRCCRHLLMTESLLVGASSGAAFAALWVMKDRIPPDSNCVMIFPDRGERYLDTVYSDDWVAANIGSLPSISSITRN